jgi:hypothetical protein
VFNTLAAAVGLPTLLVVELMERQVMAAVLADLAETREQLTLGVGAEVQVLLVVAAERVVLAW